MSALEQGQNECPPQGFRNEVGFTPASEVKTNERSRI